MSFSFVNSNQIKTKMPKNCTKGEPKVVSLGISLAGGPLQKMLGCLEQGNQKVRMHLTSREEDCHFSTCSALNKFTIYSTIYITHV